MKLRDEAFEAVTDHTYKLPNKKSTAEILHYLVVFFIFLFCVNLRMDFIGQKSALHEDEVMSVMISRCSPQWHAPWTKMSGREIKEKCFWNDGSPEQAVKDVKNLYIDNRDRPHTNFYYSLLRLWFTGVSSFDLHQTIERGCLLNMLLFVLSFLMFYMLAVKLFEKQWVQYLALLMAFGCSVGEISNSLLLRPYQLQELFLIAFTYAAACCWNGEITRKNAGQLSIFTALVMLTGYFSAIYVLMMFGALMLNRRKNAEDVKTVCISFLGALMIAQMMYVNFFKGFTCGRAGEGYHAIFSIRFLDNVSCALEITYHWMLKYLPFGCLFFIIIWKFRKEYSLHLSIIFISLAWAFGNIFLSETKDLRYVSPCFPLISLAIPRAFDAARRFFLDTIKDVDSKQFYYKFFAILSVFFIMYIVVVNRRTTPMPYLYKSDSAGRSYDGFFTNFLREHASLPVYIISPADNIYIPARVIQFCADEQMYDCVNSMDDAVKRGEHCLVMSAHEYPGQKEKLRMIERPSSPYTSHEIYIYEIGKKS